MPSMKYQVLGLIAALTAGMASAQTNSAPFAFKSADTNSDGRVNKAEFDRQVKNDTFTQLDKDKDGAVSLEEWKAYDKSPSAREHFEAMDVNHDRRVSLPEFSDAAEWKSGLKDSFTALDRDRDGHLAPDEVTGRPMFQIFSVHF